MHMVVIYGQMQIIVCVCVALKDYFFKPISVTNNIGLECVNTVVVAFYYVMIDDGVWVIFHTGFFQFKIYNY